jgi:glycosyltransferase involved in cell wall biosynthesis
MKLDIILRTHDTSNIHEHPTQSRYCGETKQKIIEKCLKSLIGALNNCTEDVKIICLDDHSTKETKKIILDILNNSKVEYKFIPLKEKGHNYSSLQFFSEAKKSKADLVYLIEDDYLHFPNTIQEMINDYKMFKTNLGDKEICIHPFDDPDNYKPQFIFPSRIVLGSKRHWRTNTYTTFSFMCSPEIIRKHWDKFYILATEYMTEWGQKNNIHEGTTINEIWRNDVILFTPIPSIALHMQYEEQKNKYIDWKKLWDSIN